MWLTRRSLYQESMSGRILSQVWFITPLDEELGIKRDKTTLLPLIKKYFKAGTIICRDMCAHNSLSLEVYVHHTINHSENFVDGKEEVHTQTVGHL